MAALLLSASLNIAGAAWALPAAGTWSAGAAFPNEGASEQPALLSCGSPSFCAALDQQMAGAWIYDQGKWVFSAHAGPSGGFGPLTGLQCFADKTCIATDAEADLVTYVAGKWKSRPGPTQNGGGPMGCTSPGLCLFVDGVGQSYTWDGHSFSRPRVAYPSLANTMGSGAAYIACAAGSSFCAVVDELGDLGTYSGGHWGPLADPYGSAPLGAGCAGPTACAVAFRAPTGHPAAHGDWAVYDGHGWSRTPGGTAGFPNATSAIASALSCGQGFCADLDLQGRSARALVWSGKSWASTGSFAAATGTSNFLACAGPNWCMAVFAPAQGVSSGHTWLLHLG